MRENRLVSSYPHLFCDCAPIRLSFSKISSFTFSLWIMFSKSLLFSLFFLDSVLGQGLKSIMIWLQLVCLCCENDILVYALQCTHHVIFAATCYYSLLYQSSHMVPLVFNEKKFLPVSVYYEQLPQTSFIMTELPWNNCLPNLKLALAVEGLLPAQCISAYYLFPLLAELCSQWHITLGWTTHHSVQYRAPFTLSTSKE